MDQDFIINITANTMMSIPKILIATCVGLMKSLLQASTQIQEQTLSFAIKLCFKVLVLTLSEYGIGNEILAFANDLFTTLPSIIK